MTAKYKAQDIASLFVQIANNIPDDHIDNLKLNKLCFYAQGWHLALFGKPLFDDEIQAWDYGPVVPCVYHTYKICGHEPIKEPAFDFDESIMTNQERELIADVYLNYGKYTSTGLANLTHVIGSPWRNVYVIGENNVIKKEDIKNYFLDNSEVKPFRFDFSEDHIAKGLSKDE